MLRTVGFEHLHLHTDFSLLDGFGQCHEYAQRAVEINQRFFTVSDHGMLGAVPSQIRSCEEICEKYNDKNKLSPIFAVELYCNPLQQEAENLDDNRKFIDQLDDKQIKEFRASPHLLAIAYTDKGYENLVQLSSWAWTKGFYRKPRVNYDILQKYKDGLIFTSCCYNSEVGRAFDKHGEEGGFAMIEKYIEMFGRDNYVLEIMLLDFKKQKPYNAFIVKAKEKYGLPIIVSQDCHYAFKEDSHYQRLMLMVQTKRTIQDIERAMKEDAMQDFFELQDANLWMKSEEELNEKWLSDYSDVIPVEIFEEAKATTVKICEKAKGVKFDRSLKLPLLPEGDERLREAVKKGVRQRGIPTTAKYLARLKEELDLITRKGFSSYFLIQKMMTDEARKICPELLGWGEGGDAVGSGRGSACGSLICYCLGITDVDPIEEDLLFSRFMSEARGGKSMKLRFSNC